MPTLEELKDVEEMRVFWCLVLSLLVNLAYGEYTHLLDFSEYDRHLDESPELFASPDEERVAREDFYRASSFKQQFSKVVATRYGSVPYFQALARDMKLNRWYSYDEVASRETRASLLNARAIGVLQSQPLALHATLLFPSEVDQGHSVIKAPLGIFPYDTQGRPCNQGFGVVHNIGELQGVRLRVGVQVSDAMPVAFELRLEDEQGVVSVYPLGVAYASGNFQERFYQAYDGRAFREVDEITPSEISSRYSEYFKASYREEKLIHWSFYSNGYEVYREYVLEWTNSKYLAPTVFPKPLYPAPVSFVRFHSLVVRRVGGEVGGQLSLFVRDIGLQYLKESPDVEFDVDDEAVWKIHARQHQYYRTLVEHEHAYFIYLILQQGRDLGFLSYADFEAHYLQRYAFVMN